MFQRRSVITLLLARCVQCMNHGCLDMNCDNLSDIYLRWQSFPYLFEHLCTLHDCTICHLYIESNGKKQSLIPCMCWHAWPLKLILNLIVEAHLRPHPFTVMFHRKQQNIQIKLRWPSKNQLPYSLIRKNSGKWPQQLTRTFVFSHTTPADNFRRVRCVEQRRAA